MMNRDQLQATGWAIGLFLTCLALSFFINWPQPAPGNAAMGGEYGNIAESLVTGHGYAHPFGVESGPTAWMPPLLTWIIAAVFLVCGVKTYAAFWVLITLNCLAMAGSCYFLTRAVEGWWTTQQRHWLAGVLFLLLLIQQEAYLRNLSDFSLLLLLTAMLACVFWQSLRIGWRPLLRWWIALALLTPLANPSLVLCLFLAAVWVGAGWREGKADLFPQLASARLLFMAVLAGVAISTGAWTMRNRLVLERWIPAKSNLGYEAYLAQVETYRGVLSYKIFLARHPFAPGPVQEEFRQLGEIRFVEKYGARARQAITADPVDYLRRVGFRLWNALIFTLPGHDAVAAGRHLTLEDVTRLQDSGLLHVLPSGPAAWISLDLAEAEWNRRVDNLPLDDPQAVRADWQRAGRVWREKAFTWPLLLAGCASASLPGLAGLWLLLRRSRDVLALSSLLLCLVYLSPYLLVSHYFRYQMPLVGWQAVLILSAVASFHRKNR